MVHSRIVIYLVHSFLVTVHQSKDSKKNENYFQKDTTPTPILISLIV